MKNIVILAAAGMALVGCVKNEQPPIDAAPSDKPISFEAPVISKAPVSRAAIPGEIGPNEAYPAKESFKVWGWWYDENGYSTFENRKNYMGTGTAPVTVTNEDEQGYWAPASPYYWPKSGSLTFAAYSPADATDNATSITHTATGLQIAGFTVPTVGSQYDLLYSDRAYNKKKDDGNTTVGDYTGVQINFHHALSSIRFQVSTKETYTTATIKITKIEVLQVANQGNFNQGITPDGSTGTSAPEWTSQTGTADYTAFNGEYEVTPNAAVPTDVSDLILLPQDFTDNSDAQIKITYTMQMGSGDPIPGTATYQLNKATNATEWECGNRYTYNITFSLDEIHFAPSVTTWTEVPVGGGNNDIDL